MVYVAKFINWGREGRGWKGEEEGNERGMGRCRYLNLLETKLTLPCNKNYFSTRNQNVAGNVTATVKSGGDLISPSQYQVTSITVYMYVRKEKHCDENLSNVLPVKQ